MTSKILNIATASNGKKFQRTTKLARFKFAFVIIYPNAQSWATFYETEQEAIQHKDRFIANYERNQASIASYETKHDLADVIIEVIPVVHSAK